MEHYNSYGKKKVLKIWYFLDFRSDPDSDPHPEPDPQQADADPHHCLKP